MRRRPLGTHLAQGKLGEDLGSRSPVISASSIARPDCAEDVGGGGGQLDEAVFEQFLDALLVLGSVLDEVDSQPGVVRQLAGLHRGDEDGAQHPALVEFGESNRVELVGIRPARHLLHIAGVDQPPELATGFKQVEDMAARSPTSAPQPPVRCPGRPVP